MKKFSILLLTAIIILTVGTIAFAATKTATATGNWNTTATLGR